MSVCRDHRLELVFFFSSRRRHTRLQGDWSSDVCSSDLAVDSSQTIGHLLFLGSALAWACYTVAMRRARLDGLHAAAISGVGSLLLYLPPYAFVAGTSLFEASLSAIALQALVQGLLTAVVSYLLYGSAV